MTGLTIPLSSRRSGFPSSRANSLGALVAPHPLDQGSGGASVKTRPIALHRSISTAWSWQPSPVRGAVQSAEAQAHLVGEWTTLSSLMPINPIHAGLLRSGKVLVVAGSENDPTIHHLPGRAFRSGHWAPPACSSVPWDLFCNALSFLPDGRALVVGGTLQYDPFRGLKTTTIFDPATEKFMQVQDMAHGRWYPTNTVLVRWWHHAPSRGSPRDRRPPPTGRSKSTTCRRAGARSSSRSVDAAVVPVAAPAAELDACSSQGPTSIPTSSIPPTMTRSLNVAPDELHEEADVRRLGTAAALARAQLPAARHDPGR